MPLVIYLCFKKAFRLVSVKLKHINHFPVVDSSRSDPRPPCVQTLVSSDPLGGCWWCRGCWRGAYRATTHSRTPGGGRIESYITSSSDRCAAGWRLSIGFRCAHMCVRVVLVRVQVSCNNVLLEAPNLCGFWGHVWCINNAHFDPVRKCRVTALLEPVSNMEVKKKVYVGYLLADLKAQLCVIIMVTCVWACTAEHEGGPIALGRVASQSSCNL